NLPGVYATINRILDENDGIPAGISFETSDPAHPSIGDVIQFMGRPRFVERPDGRCMIYADEAKKVISAAGMRQELFIRERKEACLAYLAERIVRTANSIVAGASPGESEPGLEIARELVSPAFARAHQHERLKMALDLLNGMTEREAP